MRGIQSLFLTFLTLLMLFGGTTGVVFAQDDEEETTDEEEEESDEEESSTSSSCDCWCKTDDGAQQVEGKESASTVESCRDNCREVGWGYSMCSTTGETPAGNDKCWSQYECENNIAEIDGEEFPYEWDTEQAPECISGERYCYRPPEAVDLSVVLGSVEEVNGIQDYINAAYNFLLPAGAMLAVLMLMIAGLQYMLARGNQGAISKAKDRIRNAVTGIIILLTAAAMAQLADPSLTNLNRLTPPAIRTVVFIDPDSTCEAMREAGLTIEADVSGQENCGDTGTITELGETEATVQEGDSCNFSGCTDAYSVCVGSSESDTGFDCLRCSGAYETLTDTVGATPSNTMCGQLENVPEVDEWEAAGEDDHKYMCGYYDAAFFSVDFNSCIEFEYPEDQNYLDCATLRQDALADDSESCRAYDNVWAAYEYSAFEASAGGALLDYAFDIEYVNEIDDLQGANGFDLLERLCVSDPCGLAPEGESCRVFTGDTSLDDISEEAIEYMDAVDEAVLYGILAGDDLTDFFGGTVIDTFANCANDTSAYGIYYCKDSEGELVDCNPTW